MNSKESINNWQYRLTDEEINLIKEKTQSVASLFYDIK